jgi:hypothetical protein
MKNKWIKAVTVGAVVITLAVIIYATVPFIACILSSRSANNVYRRTSQSEPLFNANDPFPTGISQAKIGTPLSILQSLYPNGKVEPGSYTIDREEGPFNRVNFALNLRGDDSQVEWVIFHFRDSDAKEYVKEEALAVFGCKRVRREWGIWESTHVRITG